MGKIIKYFEKDYYTWSKTPKSEISRLEKTLVAHLRKMKVKKSKKDREEFVQTLLKQQNFTCAFAGNDSRYCWNHPRNKKLKYLKLEWGHKLPAHYGNTSQIEENLILLCARCNNQLQSSRTIKQLIPELAHKLKIIKNL